MSTWQRKNGMNKKKKQKKKEKNVYGVRVNMGIGKRRWITGKKCRINANVILQDLKKKTSGLIYFLYQMNPESNFHEIRGRDV